MEHSSYDLLELMRRCTLRLTQGSGHGTGFFVAPGFLLTCAHVVEASHANATLRELQETIVAHYGAQKASEWRSLLRLKLLRLLLLDDLGDMGSGQRGLAMRRWLRGLDDLCRTKLLMVSNERLDVLFRKDDPTRDSPLAGLDPLPVQLDPLPSESCAQIMQQRLASTSLDIAQFADLFVAPCQPKALLDRCAARYDVLQRGNR